MADKTKTQWWCDRMKALGETTDCSYRDECTCNCGRLDFGTGKHTSHRYEPGEMFPSREGR